MAEIKLTKEDWELILDALENYKSKDFSGVVVSTLVQSMLPQNNPIEKLKAKQAIDDEMKAFENKRKETSKLVDRVRAKIVILEDAGELYDNG